MDAQTLLNRVGESLSVGRVFGEPIERNGILVIPVAFVAGGGGGGEGQIAPPTNQASDRESQKAESDTDESAGISPPIGSGGGLGGVIVPMGVYVIRGDTVQWKPAVQPLALALCALGFVRVIVKAGSRLRLRSKA
jgi:uncharacterized spore protein YtfJ